MTTRRSFLKALSALVGGLVTGFKTPRSPADEKGITGYAFTGVGLPLPATRHEITLVAGEDLEEAGLPVAADKNGRVVKARRFDDPIVGTVTTQAYKGQPVSVLIIGCHTRPVAPL